MILGNAEETVIMEGVHHESYDEKAKIIKKTSPFLFIRGDMVILICPLPPSHIKNQSINLT